MHLVGGNSADGPGNQILCIIGFWDPLWAEIHKVQGYIFKWAEGYQLQLVGDCVNLQNWR